MFRSSFLISFLTLFYLSEILNQWTKADRVYDPPTLTIVSEVVSDSVSNGREVDVKAGVPLHIRCAGSQPLVWFYPKNLQSSEFEIKTKSSHCNETVSCESSFFIQSTSYKHTGLYTCHYNDSITQYETENADSAFIFFNDPTKLIAPGTGNAVIDVLPNKLSSVEIPCIPTNSKTEVTLVKAYSTVTETKRVQLKPMKVEAGSIEDFTYDPKVGFHIRRESLDGSSLFCNFTLNNESQIVQVVIYFPLGQEDNSKPEIDSSLAKKVVVNGRFALICKFEVSGNAKINMQWLYPQSRNSIIRVKEPKIKTLYFGRQNVTIYSSKIIVSKTSTTNEGWYTCQVTNNRRKSFETHKYITVYDSTKKPFVELSNDYPTNSVKTSAGEQLKLRVYINAFPKVEFDGIYWLRDGRVIDALNTERYVTNYTDNEASLDIANVTAQDIAFYSLKVSTELDVVSENTIHVLIEGEPFISLSADNQTARGGSKHKIACHAIGYPPPAVEMFYTNCTAKCENATVLKIDEEKHVNEESVKIDKQVNKVILTMDYTAKKSGTYICFAKNKFGRVSKNHLLIVSSKVDGSTMINKHISQYSSAANVITFNLLNICTSFVLIVSFYFSNYIN